jgi:hypothetical protein
LRQFKAEGNEQTEGITAADEPEFLKWRIKLKNRFIETTNLRWNRNQMLRHRFVTPSLLALVGLFLIFPLLAVTPRASATSLFVDGCVPAPSGMVSWWPGDNNPNDIVGTNQGPFRTALPSPPG